MSTAAMEERVRDLRNGGMGVLKIGRTLGVGTGMVQRSAANTESSIAMTTATYADEFKSSPRYKAILAVFAAVHALPEDKPVNEVLKLMNETSRNCNGIERDRLPDPVRKALADRGRRF